MKEETLEEAAAKYVETKWEVAQEENKESFEEGAKWQQETIEDKFKSLVSKWQQQQVHYEILAEQYIDDQHNNRKFTYKAVATRDCWKQLLEIYKKEQGL